ncbi:site-specific integrase [Okeania sp. SIO2B9]|uniref:tyrosine-type recombinase/integrase n=1 Tax=Okeania sp. SIO2B9 TaxID=2607782 RepID=UPI00142B39AD|nr:site-specific integrase [Okeania sp. SIO2B9]NES90697.1 site-specific integrase [Okeania sp. SIO2B9]
MVFQNISTNTKLYVRKGNINIEVKKKATGDRIRRSLGLEDTLSNQALALSIQNLIEKDLSINAFDASLDKYIDKCIKVTETPDDLINLTSLWHKYIEFKRKYWSPTTYANSGLVFAKRFSKLKNQDLRFPQKIQQELFENFSLDAVKRSCIQIKAAINWGLQERIISNVKWTIPNKAFEQLLKRQKEENDINPFSNQERDRIIEAFKTDCFAREKGRHSQYYFAIHFWFLTGCRTGELLGLQWQDIKAGYLTFCRVRSQTNVGEVTKNSLKQQHSRKFPINQQLSNLLVSIPKSKDYVFVNKVGKPISFSSLITCWKRVLSCLQIEYKRPYQCRHTFITDCLKTGKLSPSEVAKLVGTSPAMIYKHYLGAPENIDVPEL